VFGRDASFDPATDPIIRIEASRLRRSLERYYLTVGRRDPIRIDIPKGSYVPTFLAVADPPAPSASVPEHSDGTATTPSHPTTAPAAGSARDRVVWRRAAATGLIGALLLAGLGIAWSVQYPPFSAQRQAAAVTDRATAIFVAPFDNDGGNTSDDGLVRGFTREVIVGLARFDGLHVYGPETNLRTGAGVDPNSIHDLPVEFVLTGGVTVSENKLHVAVFLIDPKTGRNLWANIFERDITARNVLDARGSIARQIALALVQSHDIPPGGR
jgi:adenylate cyclase